MIVGVGSKKTYNLSLPWRKGGSNDFQTYSITSVSWTCVSVNVPVRQGWGKGKGDGCSTSSVTLGWKTLTVRGWHPYNGCLLELFQLRYSHHLVDLHSRSLRSSFTGSLVKQGVYGERRGSGDKKSWISVGIRRKYISIKASAHNRGVDPTWEHLPSDRKNYGTESRHQCFFLTTYIL